MRLGVDRGQSTRALLEEPRSLSFNLRAVWPQNGTALYLVGAKKGWELGCFRNREINGVQGHFLHFIRQLDA